MQAHKHLMLRPSMRVLSRTENVVVVHDSDTDKVHKHNKNVAEARREYSIMTKLNGFEFAVQATEFALDGKVARIGMSNGGINLLEGKGRLETAGIDVAIAQMVRAVAGLHRLGVAHLDLKLDNFLVDAQGRVRLCDFGFSTCGQVRDRMFVGSASYAAPEIWTGLQADPKQSDLWSLAICTFAVATGRYPFETARSVCPQYRDFEALGDDVDALRRLRSVWSDKIDNAISSLSALACETVCVMLCCDPARRRFAA